MRTVLISYMHKRPVRSEEHARHTDAASPSMTSILNSLLSAPSMRIAYRTMIITLLITALAAGGVTWAAEGTLPGDTLYPVKISVTEHVRGWTALSAQAKTEWNTWAAERRLKEAEMLAVQGRLDADTTLRIEEAFTTHASKASDRIETMEEENDADVAADLSSRFEASLTAHEKILASLAEHTEQEDVRINIEPLLVTVRAKTKTFANARASAESRIATSTAPKARMAAEGKLEAAEHKLKNSRSFIETREQSLDASQTAEALIRLGGAARLIAEGKVNLDAEAYGDAFAKFQKAIRVAQEAKLLAEATNTLNIRISTSSATIIIHEEIEEKNDEHRDEDDNYDDEEKDRGQDERRHDQEDKDYHDHEDGSDVNAQTTVRVEANSGGSGTNATTSGSVDININIGP